MVRSLGHCILNALHIGFCGALVGASIFLVFSLEKKIAVSNRFLCCMVCYVFGFVFSLKSVVGGLLVVLTMPWLFGI